MAGISLEKIGARSGAARWEGKNQEGANVPGEHRRHGPWRRKPSMGVLYHGARRSARGWEGNVAGLKVRKDTKRLADFQALLRGDGVELEWPKVVAP